VLPSNTQHPGSGTLALDAAELTSTLQAAIGSPTYKPPLLPSVALEVMQLARTPDVQLTEVLKLLERDPVLAARVLGIAQSARFTARSPVVTLKQAAVRLGLEELSQIVLQAALELKVFRAPGFDRFAAQMNAHATAVAHVTREVCRRAQIRAEHGFVCALLHDIGFSACLTLVAETPRLRRVPFDALVPTLDAIHADASGLLARAWRLPDAIVQVVSTHHEPVVDGVAQPINAALIVAEQLCWEAGAGLLPPPRAADPGTLDVPEQPEGLDSNGERVVRRALEVIGFDPQQLAAVRGAAFDLVHDLGVDAKPG
jgi:HD-like signal output (HDOD) protein